LKIGFFFVFINIFFVSCVSTKVVKSDLSLYRAMINANSAEFSRFSSAFIDLKTNHPSSLYLKSAFSIAILKSIENQELIIAKYYLEQSKDRFVNSDNVDYYDFYEFKIDFLSIDRKNRMQNKLLDLDKKADLFIAKYSKSSYLYLIKDMKSSVLASLYLLNDGISKLYTTLGKSNASKTYQVKNTKINIRKSDIVEPKSFFLIEIFE